MYAIIVRPNGEARTAVDNDLSNLPKRDDRVSRGGREERNVGGVVDCYDHVPPQFWKEQLAWHE